MKPRLPKTIRTGKAIANLIREHFKIPCDRQKIRWWQTKVNPPFPAPHDHNAFDVKECFDWVKAFNKRQGIHQNNGEDSQMELLDRKANEAFQQKKITAAEREIFQFELEKGLYIKRDEAEFTIRTAMREYHKMVKQEIEVNSPQSRKEILVELGATPELIAQFLERDLRASVATVDRIEKRCEQ